MAASTSIVRSYPVATFAALTVALSVATAFAPLPAHYKPQLFPLIIIFIPTLVACTLAALDGGTRAVQTWLGSLTRNPAGRRGLILAMTLPLVLWLVARELATMLGLAPELQVRPVPLLMVMALMFSVSAAAEEIGWRGYALPRLLERHSPLVAGLVLGVPWAAVHVPLHLPGMMSAGTPVISTLIALPAMSVALAWIYVRSGHSVLAATLFHAAQNFFGFAVGAGMSGLQGAWLVVVVYVGTALLVLLISRQPFMRKQRGQAVVSAVCPNATIDKLPG